MLLTQGSWDEVRDRLIAYIEHKLDLIRIRWNHGENTNAGYNRTLNILTVAPPNYSFTTVQLHGYFSRYVRGILWAKISRKVGLIGAKNVLDWDINDVFNDSTTQEVNRHRHTTRADLAIDYYNTNLNRGIYGI